VPHARPPPGEPAELSAAQRVWHAAAEAAPHLDIDAVTAWRRPMDGLIYLIGLIVVIMAILSFFGLR
jgi:hypothetical protein